MTRDELMHFHDAMNLAGLAIMEAKNHDYAGESGDTPFANFEIVEKMGLCSTEHGMVVRMADKFMRIVSFVKSGSLSVKDESVRDTIIDLRNYLVLLAAYMEDKT